MSSDLRRRGDGSKSSAQASAESYLSALNDMAPTPVKKYVGVAAPYVVSRVRGIEILLPYLFNLYDICGKYYVLLQPYKVDLL